MKRRFCARHPSNSNSWRCENEAFVRDILQIPTVEDVKTKLSCETSFQFQQLKMWKRRFCARHPSNSKSWRCENGAFVPDILQIPTVENVKTELSCQTSFKFQQLKMWTRRFRARHLQIPTARTFRHSDFQTFRLSDVQTFRHPNIQTFRHSDIQIFRRFQTVRHSDFQSFRLSDIQTFRHSDFQTFRHSDFQTFRHSDTQTFRHSDFQPFIQTFRLSDIQTFRRSDFQSFRHSDFQTFRLFRPSDIQTFRLSDFQTFRLWDFETLRQSFHHILKIRNTEVWLQTSFDKSIRGIWLILSHWLYHIFLFL